MYETKYNLEFKIQFMKVKLRTRVSESLGWPVQIKKSKQLNESNSVTSATCGIKWDPTIMSKLRSVRYRPKYRHKIISIFHILQIR